jgi:hypothetical protein
MSGVCVQGKGMCFLCQRLYQLEDETTYLHVALSPFSFEIVHLHVQTSSISGLSVRILFQLPRRHRCLSYQCRPYSPVRDHLFS